MSCVYLARNLVNNKRYVGKTIMPLGSRVSNHCTRAKKSTTPFARALTKHGPEHFEWIVLYESDNDTDLLRVEVVMIAMLRTKVPRGYNLTNGGEGLSGHKHSLVTRAKMSADLMGRSYGPLSVEHREKLRITNTGRKRSPESIAKSAAAHKGSHHSAEAKARISIAKTGKRLSLEHRERISLGLMGHACSQETRDKFSAAHKGKKRPAYSPEWKAKLSAATKAYWERKKMANTPAA
jgi:group I intron endonuclease